MLRVLIALLALAAAGLARAAPPPLSAYGALPNIEAMSLSPSGERFAYVRVNGDDRQVVVKTLKGEAVFTADCGKGKIHNVRWAGEDHLVLGASATYRVGDPNGRWEVFQAVVVDLTKKTSYILWAHDADMGHAVFGFGPLIEKDGRWYGYFEGYPAARFDHFSPGAANLYPTFYRVDLDSQNTSVAAQSSNEPRQWVLGPRGEVVAGAQYNQELGLWSFHAGLGGREFLRLKEPLGDVDVPGLGRTPGTVLVDVRWQVEEWNLTDGTHTPLPAEGPIAGLIHDPGSLRLLGVAIAGDRTRQAFFDPALSSRLGALARALKSQPRLMSWSADFSRLILFMDGEGDAGTWWIVDGRSVRPYGYAYPSIPDASVGQSRSIVYHAADGLEIHGILTLPPGREAKGLPLVVLPHGGPEGHDETGFDWWAQAFASRGYAVFQPNFRGSDGYGKAFRDAGFGEWGRKMQTDISDGVAELAHQGVIDARRACVVGGSYGGYAALAGITLQSGLYRCAVAYGGVFDLFELMAPLADPDAEGAGVRYLHKYLGVKGQDPVLGRLSPARLANRADAPVLLIHGAGDSVVPITQSRHMAEALKKAGKSVQLIELAGADHGLLSSTARTQMLEAAVAFVERNNPSD